MNKDSTLLLASQKSMNVTIKKQMLHHKPKEQEARKLHLYKWLLAKRKNLKGVKIILYRSKKLRMIADCSSETMYSKVTRGAFFKSIKRKGWI